MALQYQTNPLTVLSGVSTTGAGNLVLDNGCSKACHSLIVTTGASVTAGTVKLELSHDNTNWFTTSVSLSTTAQNTVYAGQVADTPAQYVRANITSGITGGTVTASVASA
jgi:hypothetical protein